MKKHEKAFQEIKVYYNDITLNNLELIKSLKVFQFIHHNIQTVFGGLDGKKKGNSFGKIRYSNTDAMKQEQVEELKKKDQAGEKLLMEVTLENKRLSEPLQKSLNEVSQLKHELANYEKVTTYSCRLVSFWLIYLFFCRIN